MGICIQTIVITSETYGDFEEGLPPSQEYLRIQFSPSSLSLKQRWRNNGLSANFMADFLVTFFPREDDTLTAEDQKTELQGIICYIANELLENAMKFTDDTVHIPISITLYLLSDRLVFISTNSTSLCSKEKLQNFIHQITSRDIDELYMERLEKSALNESDDSVGLGLLTMINDYLARVGWKIETLSEPPDVAMISTMVQLTL